MTLNSINPSKTKAWKKLEAHFKTQKEVTLQNSFNNEASRFKNMSIHWEDFLVDYSKNRLSSETLALLNELALKVFQNNRFQDYPRPCLQVDEI